jgi:NtrC-family two-component system response regulator AlgB
MRILIVDDEPDIRRALRTVLEAMGHSVAEAASGPGAVRQVGRQACDLALVDLHLARESGLDLLKTLRDGQPGLAGVIITAPASIDTAVEAMRRGALDYLPKPFTPDQIRNVLERVIRCRERRERVGVPEGWVWAEVPEATLESSDPLVQRTMQQAHILASSEAPVLIRGENGTGKGVLARALHAWSKRAGGAFVTVNCPCLSPVLCDSELFGHAHGTFTDAVRDTAGKVAAAEGGTLFLDEVGDLTLAIQVKLHRFLQERKYERVGEVATHSADVRIVAATNHDLDAAVASGAFREDLLYRLNVIELTLPPLRQRSDIGEQADRLLAFFVRRSGRTLTGFTPEAREVLAHYSWPGNLRELRNAVEGAVILSSGPEVGLADLPERIRRVRVDPVGPVEIGRRISLELLEKEHIRRVLDTTSSREEAAHVLGIDLSTLYRKRKKLGL